jgi:GDPmannose 4,6-dehydratase
VLAAVHVSRRGDPLSGRALVTGARGQDGSYLVEFLLTRGYQVHAQSRRPRSADYSSQGLLWHQTDISEPTAVEELIAVAEPDEIYNLASFSRPSESWKAPYQAVKANALIPLLICETVRKLRPECRIFQATSSEIFGDSRINAQDETTPCQPQTPYGIAKLAAHQTIGIFRKNFGLHASSGIMFNHESPRRPLSYVSQKIAHAAAAVSLGLRETAEQDERGQPILCDGVVQLGNLDVRRDFGFAGDYVEIMHRMLQSDTADDYVIGTGASHSIRELCELAFRHVGHDWRDHVKIDPELFRAVDSHYTAANPAKVAAQFGWRARTSVSQLVAMMVDRRRDALTRPGQ